MANKPTQPIFPLGLETAEQSKLAGVLNTGIIEHGPDAVMTVPEGDAVDGLPSAVRYNSASDEFEGYYENGGWLPLGGGGIRWEVLPHASTATLAEGRGYLVDNSSGVSTVVFPDPTRVGDSVTVCDLYGKFSVYPLTIDPNGHAIYGSTEPMTLSTDSVSATFTWSGDARGWIVTAGVGLGQGRVYSRTIFTTTLATDTTQVTLATQPSIVDVYVDGKRLLDSKYSLDGYNVNFSPALTSGSELQIIQYVPIQLGAGGSGSGGGTVITWVYNSGSAVGGETTITLDVDAEKVSEIFINGTRQQKDLGFQYNSTTKLITLADELDAGDEVVVVINGDPTLYNQIDRTPNEVARAANVPVSQVILSSDTITKLNGKTVIYDVVAQKSWGLPAGIPTTASIVSVSGNQLTYVVGSTNTTVTLLDVADSATELRKNLAGKLGFGLIGAANYADVRANTNPVNGRVYSLGKVNKYDGGFGIFESDPTDATSADNGGTILVDTTGLRWKRQTVGAVNLGWFATGDGSTDDTAATQAAVDATPWGGTLIVPTPKSMYKISSAITINKPIKIVGDGGSTVARKQMPCFKAVGHNDIFKLVPVLDGYRFDYGITGVTIQDLMLEGPDLNVNGYCGVSVDETVNAGVFHVRENNFSGLHIRYFDFGIKLAGVVYLNNFYNVHALWCSTGCNIDKVDGSAEGGSDQNRFFGCEFVLNGRGLSLSEFSFAGSQSIIGCTISENTTVGIVAGWNTSFYMSGSQIENNPIGVNFTIPASVGNPASEGSKTIIGNCFLFNGYDIWVQKSTTALSGGFPFPLLITGNGFAQTKNKVLYIQAPTGPAEFDSRQFIFSSSNCYSGTDGKLGPVPFSMIESDWKGYNGFKEDGKVTLNTAVTGDVSKNVGFFNVPYGHQCYIKYNIVSVPTNAASGNTQVSASITINNVNNPSSPVVIKSDFGREGEVILSRENVGSGLNVMIAMNANDAASTAIGVISYCII